MIFIWLWHLLHSSSQELVSAFVTFLEPSRDFASNKVIFHLRLDDDDSREVCCKEFFALLRLWFQTKQFHTLETTHWCPQKTLAFLWLDFRQWNWCIGFGVNFASICSSQFIQPKTLNTGKTRHENLKLKYFPKNHVFFPNDDDDGMVFGLLLVFLLL